MANSMSTHIHLKYEEKQIELNVYQIWFFNKNEWTLWIFRYHFISFNSGVNIRLFHPYSLELKLNKLTNTANNPYAYWVRLHVCVWNSYIDFRKQNVCEHTFSIRKSHRMYSSNDHHETERCIFYCDGKGVLVCKWEWERLLMAILWLNSTWNIKIDYIIAKARTSHSLRRFPYFEPVCCCVCFFRSAIFGTVRTSARFHFNCTHWVLFCRCQMPFIQIINAYSLCVCWCWLLLLIRIYIFRSHFLQQLYAQCF